MAKLKKDVTEDSQMYGIERREREVRNTRRLTMSLLSALFVGVLILSAVALHAHYQDVASLEREGRTVSAVVTDRSESKKHPGDCYLDYSFVVQNREISGYQKVSPVDYLPTRIGGTITITYLPANPKLQAWGTVTEEKVRTARNSSFWALGLLTFFFALTLGVVWLCLPRLHPPHRVFFNKG